MILDTLAQLVYSIPHDQDQMSDFFDALSEFVFQKVRLVINQENFRFSEIEFYVKSHSHKDMFTHDDPLQSELGRWYVHESGIDMTFGNSNMAASILIRGLKNEGSRNLRGMFISGPLQVLKKICSGMKTIDSTNHDFYIEYVNGLEETVWIRHSRIGLSKETEIKRRKEYYDLDTNDESDLFYNRPYRYVAWLEPYHSFRNKLKVMEDEFKAGTDVKLIRGAFSYTPNFLK
jgi:hypothetical protein